MSRQRSQSLHSLGVRFCASLLLTAGGNRSIAAQGKATPAIPVDATTAVLRAFQTHTLVALGEGQHWNMQGHSFRLALVRAPAFAASVNDIVVEFGSSRYQGTMDRFIRGDSVSYDSLRLAWENTTAPNAVWDLPIYEEFFRALRAINVRASHARQLRVLLADPPIDWDQVRTKEDVLPWMDKRDAFAAELIQREVVARGRRALLIFGDGHLWRSDESPTLVGLLKNRGVAIYGIATPTSADVSSRQPDVSSWRAPSIASLPGTQLGATDFAFYYQLTEERWRSVRMQDQFDALLYLGPPSSITLATFSQEKCRDAAYMKMRTDRMGLFPWYQDELKWIERQCRNAARE